jgi:hypothetical protein
MGVRAVIVRCPESGGRQAASTGGRPRLKSVKELGLEPWMPNQERLLICLRQFSHPELRKPQCGRRVLTVDHHLLVETCHENRGT